MRYTDPTGHVVACDPDDGDICQHNYPAPSPVPAPSPNNPNDPTDNEDVPNPGGITLDTTINLWPDYYIGSLFIPIGNPIFGINISGIIDAYGNVYFDIGVGASLGPSLNGGGGWLLGPDNDHEYIVEDFLQGHSVNVSFGDVLGVGVNNVNPSYMQSGDDEGSGIENISVEGLATSQGATLVFGWGWLIYDNGDDTPWIWQGD